MATLSPEWVPDPNNPGKYKSEQRPGWLRDRAGRWYGDPTVRPWYRDESGRIIWLPINEASAEDDQPDLQTRELEAVGRIRRAAREVLGG